MAGIGNAVGGPEAAPYLAKAGGTMTGTLTLNTSAPSAALDAASKGYVDNTAQGRLIKDPCVAATTGAFSATYANGSSGVGATITGTVMAAFAPDGVTVAVGDRVLFKDQASTFQNGIYTTTTLGTGAVLPVFTRATDMDLAAEFKGATTFIIGGSTQAGQTYTETATVVTVGTDAVTFALTGDSTAVTSVATSTGLTGGTITSTGTLSFASIAANSIWANVTGGAAVPTVIGTNTFLQSVVMQVITATGASTYTPTTGMRYCIVELQGAGGSGGAVTGGTVGQASGGSGGGGGGYCRKTYTAAQIGANAAVAVGAGGAAAAAGANNGTAGGNSTFTPAGAGAILTATGGGAGLTMAKSASAQSVGSGAGGTGTNGDLNINGQRGGNGASQATGLLAIGGDGGGSYFSSPTALNYLCVVTNNVIAAISYGGGSAGASDIATADTQSSIGGNGICYITEFVAV